MLKGIVHVGLTVTDLDRSVAFYRDVLGLAYLGEMEMEGLETERLFQRKDCKAGIGCAASGDDSICWTGTRTADRRSVSYLHFGVVLFRRGHRPGVPAP